MFATKPFNLRFTAVMIGFVGVVFLTYREDVLGPVLTPLTLLTARTILALLQLSGIEVARLGTVISHPHGFAYEIYYRCTGFLPVAFFTVSILAYPGILRRKVIGLAVGVPILVALNFTRLIHLFYIGVYDPAIYHLAHKVLWEGFIILAIFGLWLGWRQWADSKSEEGQEGKFGRGKALNGILKKLGSKPLSLFRYSQSPYLRFRGIFN